MKISVIIPMYNEKAASSDCAEKLSNALESDAAAFSYEYEIIFSDDGSSDGCGDIVRRYAASHPLAHGKIEVITSPKNEGKGGAVRRGMLHSSGDWALFTDCDLAYGCGVICDMLRYVSRSDEKPDIVIGSRAIHREGYHGYTFLRKTASKAFMFFLSRYAGFKHSDSQCGVKMFSRSAADRIFSRCSVNGWAFDLETLLYADKLGFSVREYPVKVINHRDSKIHLIRDSLKMLSEVSSIKKKVKNDDCGYHSM